MNPLEKNPLPSGQTSQEEEQERRTGQKSGSRDYRDEYDDGPETEMGDEPPVPPNFSGGGRPSGEDDFKRKYFWVTLISSFFSFFFNFLIFIIIIVIFLSMVIGVGLAFVEITCNAVNAVEKNWWSNKLLADKIPPNVRTACDVYIKLKNGCLDKPTLDKAVDNVKQVDKSGLSNLTCIGKTLGDTNSTVSLYGTGGIAAVDKKIIKEIIANGTKAGANLDGIRLTIAMQPLLTLENAWKENNKGGCYGILQLCTRFTPNSKLNPNYEVATEGMNIKSVSEYQQSPVLQMRSIQNLLDKRSKSFDQLTCLEPLLRNKSMAYKYGFIFNEVQCEGDSAAVGLDKEKFAQMVEKNYNATDCLEFKAIMANKIYTTIDEVLIKERQYVETAEAPVLPKSTSLKKNKNNDFELTADAVNFSKMDSAQCKELQKYKDFILEASKTYSNNLLPLSPQLIGAILSRESHVGRLLDGGCAGYGDNGNGHGLGQADPTSGDGLTGRFSAPGIKLSKPLKDRQSIPRSPPKITKSYQNTNLVWSECRDGIMYLAATMVEKQMYAHDDIVRRLSAAGFNMAADASGWKDLKTKKAYMQTIINSYNAGQGGIQSASCDPDPVNKVARDGCTTGGDYGSDVFKRAVDAGNCLGYGVTDDAILTADGSAGSGNNDLVCANDRPVSDANAGDTTIPLVTRPGIKVTYNQPYPFYLDRTAHNGIDMGPQPTDPENTKVVAIVNGEITSDAPVLSTSCFASCTPINNKMQRKISIKGEDGITYEYVHLNTSKDKQFKTKGDKVKIGDVVGQIDNFYFVHLHFSVIVAGKYVQPIDHIKGWPSTMVASSGITATNVIPAKMHEKLPGNTPKPTDAP